MNTGKILVGLLAGAAAGAALGVLLSPGRDSEPIKKMISKKEKYSDAIKENVVNFLFRVIEKITAEKEEIPATGSAK